ncbi:MAG: hypothetical protein WC471_02050 [Candidatus Woesearchaeota archaeon]
MNNITLGRIKFFSGLFILIYSLINLYYMIKTGIFFSSFTMFGERMFPLLIGIILMLDGMKDGE